MLNPQNVPLRHIVVASFILIVGLLISLRLLFWSRSKNKHNYNYRHDRLSTLDNDNNLTNPIVNVTNSSSTYHPVNQISNQLGADTRSSSGITCHGAESSQKLVSTDLSQIPLTLNNASSPSDDCYYGQSFIRTEITSSDSLHSSLELDVTSQDLTLDQGHLDKIDHSNQLYSLYNPNVSELDTKTNNLYFDQERYQAYLDAKNNFD